MAGYTRQSSYTDGDVIQADDSNLEFDQMLAAFNNSTGHSHDGTSAEGPVIGLIGDAGNTTPLNKLAVDTANDRLSFYVDVAAASVEQLRVEDGVAYPVTNNDIDLGTSVFMFKDGYLAGTLESVSLQVTNVKANDGTVAGSIADSTGVFTIASAIITTADINGGTIDGTVIGGATPAAVTGTAITGTSFTTTGDMSFGDNDRAIFGAGSDLQILHDGSNSIIDEVGTGSLFIRGTNINIQHRDSDPHESMINAVSNGAVTLSHNGSPKIATTATGIDVTGTITSDGLTVDGRGSFYSGVLSEQSQLRLGYSSGFHWSLGRENATTGDLFIESHDGTDTPRLRVGSGGDISFYEDTGTTPKFYWDASAESLGIGTSSPSNPLDVVGTIASNVSTTGDLNFSATSTGGGAYRIYPDSATTGNPTWLHQSNSSENQAWVIGGVERMLLDGDDLSVTGTITAGNIFTSGTLSSSKAAGYGAMEVGGPSGGLIDLKAPFSDDYDARIIYNAGTDLQLITLADEPILLRQGGSTKLNTTSTGVSVSGKLHVTTDIAVGTDVNNGAKLTMESGEDNPSLTGTMATGHFVAQTSSGGPALNVGSDSSGTWYNSAYSNNAGIARVHRWLVGGEEAMRINIAGNVGIGTSSPNGLLELSATTGSGSLNLVSTVNSTDAGQKVAFFGAGRSETDEEMAYIQGLLVSNSGGAGNVQSGQLAFGTSGVEAMRIDSSGNITATGSVTAGDVFITGPSPLLRLTDNDAADKHATIQNNNGTTFIDGRNDTANGAIVFRGAGGGVADEYGRFDSSGHAIIPAGVTLGTSAGVYAAANTLDDYEEGTWTPTFSATGLSGVTTGGGAAGYYTKVGNKVTAWFTIYTTGTFTKGSAALFIAGLPFTSANNTGGQGATSFHNATRFDASPPIAARVDSNSTSIKLYSSINATGAGTDPVSASSSNMRSAAGENCNFISGTVVYMV